MPVIAAWSMPLFGIRVRWNVSGIIVAVFGFWIPQFADYSDVWPLLKDLSASQWFWLAVAQFLNLATYWLVYVASLPGLTFWQACVSVQTNSSIASVLPAGGAFAI